MSLYKVTIKTPGILRLKNRYIRTPDTIIVSEAEKNTLEADCRVLGFEIEIEPIKQKAKKSTNNEKAKTSEDKQKTKTASKSKSATSKEK